MRDEADATDAQLAAADAGASAPPPGPAADPVPPVVGGEPEKFYGMTLRLLGAVRQLVKPDVRAAWTDEVLKSVAHEVRACAHDYHWTLSAVVDGPVGRIGLAALPLAMPFIGPHLGKLLPQLGGEQEPEHAASSAPAVDAGGAPKASGKVAPVG